MTPVILASTSASRQGMLRRAGVVFTVIAPSVDEGVVKASMLGEGAAPADVGRALADLKALTISRVTSGLVVGADQVLELDGILYDKTQSLPQTRERLLLLRGRTHQLYAAVTVARRGEILWRDQSRACLTMRDFSDAFLDDYMAKYGAAVASSVGAYHLEGEGAQLFDAIEGDYFSILGLPLISLLSFLRQAGGLPK